jgi:hypothetical protein
MVNVRQVLASILVGAYGLFAAAMIGWLATFWMWGLGALMTAPVGLCAGLILGWKTPLRDAIMLFCTCFGGWVGFQWIGMGLGHTRSPFPFDVLAVIAAGALLFWQARRQLRFSTRYWLAIVLALLFVFNIVMLNVVRS